jgi:trimethylamine:corrinoid methyltransferase-like protein
MSCCTKRANKTEKRLRRNTIHPLSKNIPIKEYVEKINKECIVCHHCKQMFNLHSNEIKINCAGCDKFFHCHIAGKCRGKNCTETLHNGTCETTKHTLSYCLNCVNPMTVKDDTCLCNECVLDEKK